ncbi:sulfotransferase [Yunchengibacter salinarum]|uniref:sulfotransferase n=1 Tax=Yunchengibacter salinarum TaxID=3133399 RepID=UPI0035B67165
MTADQTRRDRLAACDAALWRASNTDDLARAAHDLLALWRPDRVWKALGRLPRAVADRRDMLALAWKAALTARDPDQVRTVLDRAAARAGLDAAFFREAARLAGRMQAHGAAEQAYYLYLTRAEATPQDREALVDLAYMARDNDRVRARARAVLEEAPDHARVRWMAASAAARTGREGEAMTLAAPILARPPRDRVAVRLFFDMIPHLPPADLAAARQALQAAEPVWGADARGYGRMALGRACLRLDDSAAALRHFLAGQAALGSGTHDRRAEETRLAATLAALGPLARADAAPAWPGAARPVFIMGLPRSGTTLLERMLACLPGVTALGERLHMGHLAPLIQAGAVDRLTARRRYWPRSLPQGCTLFTDKMPHNFRQLHLIRHLFPEAVLVMMRRGHKAVAASMIRHVFPDGHGYLAAPGDLGHQIGLFERFADHVPKDVIMLDYESLVTDPRKTLQPLLDALGHDWSGRLLDFHHLAAEAGDTFSAHQVRQPLNRGSLVPRWLDDAGADGFLAALERGRADVRL